MDDRSRPDTNVVLLRRKGDPCEAERERERVASTIFAEPDDVAPFSRGNLVPPRPDARDANDEVAPSADPFFDRLQAASKTDEAQRTDLADDGESTDAYFDRLVTQSPAEMSTSGGPTPAVASMPGSAQLPADLARPGRRRDRRGRRPTPSALAVRRWRPLRRPRLAWLLSTAALGVVAALIAGIAVIGESGSPGSEQQQSRREAHASSLESLRPGVLTASANPFAATALVHRPVTSVRRPHASNYRRPRSHRARTLTTARMHTTVNHRAVATKYTPAQPTPASARVTDTQNSSTTGSTPPPTQPVAPTHHTSSSNSGASSGSASPSKATLRSLVTGAGTCGCQ